MSTVPYIGIVSYYSHRVILVSSWLLQLGVGLVELDEIGKRTDTGWYHFQSAHIFPKLDL